MYIHSGRKHERKSKKAAYCPNLFRLDTKLIFFKFFFVEKTQHFVSDTNSIFPISYIRFGLQYQAHIFCLRLHHTLQLFLRNPC
jgi:hypothetical protein